MIARSYKDLSLQDYYTLQSLKDDFSVLSFIFGLSVSQIESLSVSDVMRMTSKVLFLREPPHLVECSIPPESITTEQWLDYACDNSDESVSEIVLGKHWRTVNCIEGLSKINAFNESLSSIINSFTSIFSGSSDSDSFSKNFGALHLILQVVDKTNETFTTVMSWPLVKTLNIVSYVISYSQKLEKQYNPNKVTF